MKADLAIYKHNVSVSIDSACMSVPVVSDLIIWLVVANPIATYVHMYVLCTLYVCDYCYR